MCSYLLLCITITISFVNAQKQEGYKLDPLTSYVILAPNRIRTNELVQISVSIFELLYEQLTIRLAIKVNSTEIISSREVFKSPGTRIMQLKVPNYARTGTYWLHVEGSIVSNTSILFSNLTKLTFSEQSESIFIHVSKPIYHQSQIVRFRVIPMLPDLTPAYGSLVSIDVLDASGNLFKRWLNPMTNIGGIIELDFPLSDQVHEGVWLIRANHERFSAEKTFQVKEYWRPLWDVNVTLPLRITDNQLGLYGLISANYTSGKAVKGNATVLIQLRKSGADRWTNPPRAEFRRYLLALVVYMADGSMVKYSGNRKVTLSFYCLDNTFEKQITLPISDDGVIRYTYRPTGDGCITYRLEARYIDETDRILSNDQQRLFAVNSYSGAYLQLSTSTFSPKVNEYMVIHVQTNYPTDKIHYVVVSNGNILATDQLRMPNAVTSRTFSIAVSRYMFPISHIVAYFIKDNSEIVSDSLTFYANYTHLNNVQMQVNRGKDLNQDTLEIRGYAKPGSYIAFSVMHADLYAIGGASFLREYDIVDELMTYEQHSQAPLVHTWYEDFKDIKRIYLPTSSNGADTNSTMNSSGLIIFTDANFTKANFYHTCNETENPARALPCYSLTGRDCYSRSERCDGINQCATWIDEMDCPENETKNPQPLRLINTFDILNRQWNDGAWLWHSTFVKADGQIQFRVDLPKMNADWVAGAFSVDSELGLALMQQPYLFSGTRRFYMTVELPEEAVWGEQIGVRACLFNNWNYWIEALVEVKPSPDLRIIQVGLEGRVSAYAPEVSINKAVQSLAYLEAGTSRYIYMPVSPKLPGNTSFTICAYSFIGSNCETHTIYVRMNGVTNYYHTASFLDLTSSSTLFVNNFKIIVPQKFTIPERRLHRFVPGSQKAILSVVVDIRLSGSWNISNVIDRRFSPIINKTKWPDLIDQECHRRIPSTAMVIIALRSTERTLPSGVGADKAERIVSEAVKFLSRHILNVDDLFSQMIGTYALKVAVDATSQHKISHALKRIEAFRQKGDYVYYANYRIPPPKWELDQAGRRIENPRLEMPNDGYGVLCSSIYFLLKHELGEWSFRSSEALDMVHWLASERNHVAGFASTFDSLFAMHALRKFALADTNRALYRMAIDEKISSMSTWTNRIYIDTQNYSTVTHTTFPSDNVWGDITMKLEGTGRVLLQLDAEVNVEYKEMQKMPKNPLDTEQVYRSFEIECTPGFLSRNNSIMIMTACGRWVGTTGIEPLPQSGMAVFEIGLPTGFIVLNDDLRRYVNSLMVPNLRYARANSRYVHFFFDTITPDKTCVQFTAERYYPVANITQQHRCSAYEYYEPGRYNNSLYNVVSLYTNNICNVCGSFACPYCPDYNLSKKRIKLSMSMICLMFLIRWILFYIFNVYN
uniref:CD109 antigen n=1 Tax=Schistosoma haematobium TaxID=6185 RepID=A0A095AXW1_SCHHA